MAVMVVVTVTVMVVVTVVAGKSVTILKNCRKQNKTLTRTSEGFVFVPNIRRQFKPFSRFYVTLIGSDMAYFTCIGLKIFQRGFHL